MKILKESHMKAIANPDAVDLTTVESAKAMLRTYMRIADKWGLSMVERQRLLGVGQSTFYRWKEQKVTAGLDLAILERVSYILRIYAALEILLPVPERADAWVRTPNAAPIFGGQPALDRMLGGKVGDLMVVADYLDAQRGGDFA